jgi:hypothetical protein
MGVPHLISSSTNCNAQLPPHSFRQPPSPRPPTPPTTSVPSAPTSRPRGRSKAPNGKRWQLVHRGHRSWPSQDLQCAHAGPHRRKGAFPTLQPTFKYPTFKYPTEQPSTATGAASTQAAAPARTTPRTAVRHHTRPPTANPHESAGAPPQRRRPPRVDG